MRFVPSLDARLQCNNSPWTPDYYSDSYSESDSDNEDIRSNNDSITTQESVNKLPEFLSTQGLSRRFDTVSSLVDNDDENNNNYNKPLFNQQDDEQLKIDNSLNNITNDSQTNNNNDNNNNNSNNNNNNNNNNNDNNVSPPKVDPILNYYISKFNEERRKRNETIEHLIKEEEERLRRIEEEKRRKIEEERRKREEAERKLREEAERKRQEELKKIEEEKKRKELEEKAKQEEMKRQQDLKLKQQKEAELKAKADAQAKKEQELKKLKEESDKIIIKPKEIESSFIKYSNDLQNIKNTIVEPMNQNKELKKAAGSHKRKINPKFGQLTNSQTQLTRITNEINDLILQTKQNDLVFKWILNFVSDAIISQAETEVSVKPKASIQLAKLTLNLLILFDDLKYFLLAKFYSSCPYLLGYSCSQDTEEGRIRLGWNRDEDTGKWENEIQYNERLSGISTLYSVITRLQLDSTYLGYDPSKTKHPLPISNSWIFLSRMVDVPEDQLTEAHYTMVGAWWDACAVQFLQAYGKQSRKLLMLIIDKWSSLGTKSNASKVRLKLLGEEWQNGSMKSFPNLEH